MTAAAIPDTAPARIAPAIFAGAIFTSAALVFMVEPMIAKMILPLLGGSPTVWNTAMAFFQAALLAGYTYAHLLQRFAPARWCAPIHLCVLAVAALFLPVHVTALFGAPPVGAPILWLLGVLAVSIGAPFAALSATAPLLQAWYAKAFRADAQLPSPYILYGASNLGSMLALLAYPALVEPLAALPAQAAVWSYVYGGFWLLVTAIGALVWRGTATLREDAMPRAASQRSAITARERVTWVMLAAIPSSLMLGATTYISNDVASVPLLWIIPLALYLLTFVISFQARPAIPRERALLWQGVMVAMAAGLLCLNQTSLFADLIAYLGAFFFSALVCHQALAARKPAVAHLTEFYLLLSLGGVIGGAFNAFLAPQLFNTVAEFPFALALACFARPWGKPSRREILFTVIGLAAALAIALVPNTPALIYVPVVLACVGAVAAGLASRRAPAFALVIGALCLEAVLVPSDKRQTLLTARSFFGVNRVTVENEPALGGPVHLLFHGTTIHGGQPLAKAFRCTPTYYYAPQTPIGQTYRSVLATTPRATIAVVGLGAGSVAAYTRVSDSMRFFEIDPEVARIARDPSYFTYLSACAKGRVDVVLGDARLTMAREPSSTYDLIQLDAFSGDSVPTHLLTVQALAGYARLLKPDGILLVHISNRNLALEPPVASSAKAAGLYVLAQDFAPLPGTPAMSAAPTQAMLIAKVPAALARFARDPRWRAARDKGVRAWTDDYTNIVGALADHVMQR
jgi:spermidine synthase